MILIGNSLLCNIMIVYVAITRATTNLALTYQNYDMNFYLGG